MKKLKHAAWLFSVLIAFACSGWYLINSSAVTQRDEKSLSQETDTIITHLSLRRFDKNGQLVESLTTPKMQHIPNNNTHLLQSPVITVAQENQAAWEISSKHARSIQGGETITFSQDVVFHQSKSLHNQESTLKTEELIYFPKSKRAISHKTVSFAQPGSIVYAEGMEAYLANKQVKLTSARAHYDPKHS